MQTRSFATRTRSFRFSDTIKASGRDPSPPSNCTSPQLFAVVSMLRRLTNNSAAAVAINITSACDAWITAPLTKSCGAGSCSNATGIPSCVCLTGWSGKGDFDFRSLPGQDADCDKFPAFFQALHFLAAVASFVTIFFTAFTADSQRGKRNRKRTQAILMCIVSVLSALLWGFRGFEPGRSLGVDPLLTSVFAVWQIVWWNTANYICGTSESRRVFILSYM